MGEKQAFLRFSQDFKLLTECDPFPWQWRLYELFENVEFPTACSIPTGLGKTSVLAIWLLAWKQNKALPRRLVYVVNRRTVVDQTTNDAVRIKKHAGSIGLNEHEIPTISTLRGEHADQGDWLKDPSRPSIIIGTVDLIGSGLLFSSYRAGRAHRPLHAGFLGQDVLLIHDEAHLEPAFQRLLERIHEEQVRDHSALVKPFKIMALTATPRSNDQTFELDEADTLNPEVSKRLHAKKNHSLS